LGHYVKTLGAVGDKEVETVVGREREGGREGGRVIDSGI